MYDEIDEKKEKWNDIVKESMKQCRAVKKTDILSIKKIDEIDYTKYDKVIYLFIKSKLFCSLYGYDYRI